MVTWSRRQFVRSALAGSFAVACSGCLIEVPEAADGTDEPADLGVDAVRARVSAAVADKGRDEILSALAERVQHYAGLGAVCSEISFMALRDVFGLPDGGISRALTGFPGVGWRGETCGAVTGSLVAVGLVYGRDDKSDPAGYMRALEGCAPVLEAVQGAVGSTRCTEIVEAATGQQYDWANAAETQAAFSVSPEWQQACFGAILAATHAAAEQLIDVASA